MLRLQFLSTPCSIILSQCRLTPTLMFCVLLVATLRPFFGAGPVWFIAADTSACSENWWTNLLYVNNFVEVDKVNDWKN